MGTTLTAAMLRDDEVAFGHVGDSRAYVLRDGQLKRLTKDHSLVEELRRQGRLTEEQAEEHPQRSIITRALGPEPSVNVDTMTFPARDGDVFLLCSDGLTTMVSDDEIREILVELEEPADRRQPAGRRRQPRRRARQHHRGRLPGRRRRREGGGRGRDPDLPHRRAGRPDRRAGPGGHRPAAGPGARCPHRPRRRRALKWAARDRGDRRPWWSAPSSSPARSTSSAPTTRATSPLYRGLPYELPLGISLYSKQYSIPVQEGTLSEDRQRAVTGHTLRGKDDATSLVDDIQQRPTEGRAAAAAAARSRRRSSRRSLGPPPRASRRRSVERAHPRAVRPDPGRPAGHGRVHRRADHQLGPARQPERLLRRLLPRPLRRHPRRHPDPAARRRSRSSSRWSRCSPRSGW